MDPFGLRENFSDPRKSIHIIQKNLVLVIFWLLWRWVEIYLTLKVVGNEKVGGSGMCPNLARTAAIEVCFSLNFAVVFVFMYFRFRPSKAK
jgi:hypothetical protein